MPQTATASDPARIGTRAQGLAIFKLFSRGYKLPRQDLDGHTGSEAREKGHAVFAPAAAAFAHYIANQQHLATLNAHLAQDPRAVDDFILKFADCFTDEDK